MLVHLHQPQIIFLIYKCVSSDKNDELTVMRKKKKEEEERNTSCVQRFSRGQLFHIPVIPSGHMAYFLSSSSISLTLWRKKQQIKNGPVKKQNKTKPLGHSVSLGIFKHSGMSGMAILAPMRDDDERAATFHGASYIKSFIPQLFFHKHLEGCY